MLQAYDNDNGDNNNNLILIIIIIIIIHIQAKTNDRRVRRFGDILAPLSRETKLKMRLRE